MADAKGDEIERRTRAYGREIFARLNRAGPIPLTPAWLDDQLMGLSMADPAVKVQLFRFTDALPLLKTPESISRHLREYLGVVSHRLPAIARLGLRMLPEGGFFGRGLAWAANFNARRMARKFIAGTNVQEAIEAVDRLRKQNLTFTIDLLGEATITEPEAVYYQKQYLELIDGLCGEVNRWPAVDLIDRDHLGPIPRVNVSVKLSSLFSQFDPIDPEGTSRAVRNRLRPILQRAKHYGAFVNFDMEQYTSKDVTLRIFREILSEAEFAKWPDVGIAIQAYLRDCERDLQDLRDWAERRGVPIWIRLVKGAYWDYETAVAAQNGWPIPVFTQKWESDANYERCTRFLMENHRHLRPAFGSHNVRSIAYALACGDVFGLPRGSYEFQMLFGMADPFKQALVSLGQRVRIYTPYGQLLPGMAYLVRRLLENTSNESFLRASFKDQKPEDQLLMNPEKQESGVGSQESGVRSQESGVRSQEPVVPFHNEPISEFHRAEVRKQMQAALAKVKGEFGKNYPLVIDGKEIVTSAWIESHNPSAWDQIVGRCAQARTQDAEAAVAAAKAAFPAWRDTPVEKRAEYLRRTADLMRQRKFELSAWIVYESGKPWREADGDVAEAIDFCDYYAQEMMRLTRPQRRDVLGEDNEYFYDPCGVAVVIAPWNFPLAILCGMATAALVAGNTVIMKPAEQSSIIAAKLMDLFREAGVPPGAMHFLPGIGEEIGPTLVEHRDVALIAFTGSLNVGLAINRSAATTPKGQDHVKRVVCEMGGKNAIIVDADADLDEAVKFTAESAFGYAGQKCSAGSRAIVLESIYDVFVERLIETAKSLTVAPADDPGCGVGPVIDLESRDRILNTIATGKEQTKLAYAADIGDLAKRGAFVGPHLFVDVDPQSSLAQDEIFGPVLSIIKARDLEQALEIANGTFYALTGGFFSRSPVNIRTVKQRFRVGNLYINRKITGALVDRQPFGGFKLSGIGSKAGGPDYLLQFLLPRTVTENTMRHGFVPT